MTAELRGHARRRIRGRRAAAWLALALAPAASAGTTFLPAAYWTMDEVDGDGQPLPDAPTYGSQSLNYTTFGCDHRIEPGRVGNATVIDTAGGRSCTIWAGSNFIDGSFTIEFLWRAGPRFNALRQSVLLTTSNSAVAINLTPLSMTTRESLIFTVRLSDGRTNSLTVDLEGIGRKSYGYYADGDWHHLAFTFDAATGESRIYVDGLSPDGFSRSGHAGSPSPSTYLYLGTDALHDTPDGAFDEIAVHTVALPASLVYQHALESLAGEHYGFEDLGLVPPDPGPVDSAVDLLEYAPGHVAGLSGQEQVYDVSAVDQIRAFPSPRYRPGHGLRPNYPWFGLKYLSGYPDATTLDLVDASVALQTELVTRFHHYLILNENSGVEFTQYGPAYVDTRLGAAAVELANAHPDWPAAVTTIYPQIYPANAGYPYTSPVGSNGNVPDPNALHDAGGGRMTDTCQPTTTTYWSPAGDNALYEPDGVTQALYLQHLLDELTRPIDMVNENGELRAPMWTCVFDEDPTVVADMAASGYTDVDAYLGRRVSDFYGYYRDGFMHDDYDAPHGLADTPFTMYAIDGGPDARFDYVSMREVMTPLDGQYYPTSDFYPRWPYNWRFWNGAWHGLQWVREALPTELAFGDRLRSPFVAAGWDREPERNLRPAQWLGLLKVLGVYGAEFFYTGFFNVEAPFANPAGWGWQVVMPAYAQAVVSRYEELLRDGDLLEGDQPLDALRPTGALGYSWWAGDARVWVAARRMPDSPRYVLTGTIQPSSNQQGNAALTATVTIELEGEPLTFEVRRQGSTYLYDRSTVPPSFVQLDGWHEATHPWYWSDRFEIEAELYDGTELGTAPVVRTVPPAVPGDYSEPLTFVALPRSKRDQVRPESTEYGLDEPDGGLAYHFQPRATPVPGYALSIRARSADGEDVGLSIVLDDRDRVVARPIRNTEFEWLPVVDAASGEPVVLTGLTTDVHRLVVAPHDPRVHLDALRLTPVAPEAPRGGR